MTSNREIIEILLYGFSFFIFGSFLSNTIYIYSDIGILLGILISYTILHITLYLSVLLKFGDEIRGDEIKYDTENYKEFSTSKILYPVIYNLNRIFITPDNFNFHWASLVISILFSLSTLTPYILNRIEASIFISIGALILYSILFILIDIVFISISVRTTDVYVGNEDILYVENGTRFIIPIERIEDVENSNYIVTLNMGDYEEKIPVKNPKSLKNYLIAKTI